MSATGHAQTVRDIIEANCYLVLATADAGGRPWSSPVYFAHIDFTEFFWVSSPEATHSRNIAVRPDVGIFAYNGRMDRPIACVQIIHLWRAALDRRRPHRARRVSRPREGRGWV